jgi:hypothetical protein
MGDGASQITEVAFLHKGPGGDRAGAITVLSSIDDTQADSVDAGRGFDLDDADATALVKVAVRGLAALLWNAARSTWTGE